MMERLSLQVEVVRKWSNVEAQENKINETKEADYSDLQSLLEAANLSKFNPELGYTEEKREFEKFENFLK